MAYNFQNHSVLIFDPQSHISNMLADVLETQKFKKIDLVADQSAALETITETPPDVIISSIWDGKSDGIDLTNSIRQHSSEDLKNIPILCITYPKHLHLVEEAREASITDLLVAPFSTQDITNKVIALLEDGHEALAQENQDYAETAPESETYEWPDETETTSLTELLLSHYMKQHEIILQKLQIAKEATALSINEVRETHDKVKQLDNQSIMTFTDFEKMWSGIIDLFSQSGISEDALEKIEGMIEIMPNDIKDQYQNLTQQDKSFLTLVKSLNKDAYQKAKKKVGTLQQRPNPLNGKTAHDYRRARYDNKIDIELFIVPTKK